MKIVHLTDLHVQVPPRMGDLFGKRLAGTANLYLLGRRHHFSREVQEAAIAATLDESPDLVVVTGDLTAQALDAEFDLARRLLSPVLDRFPTVVLAGNHDTYVREARPGTRMRRVFGPWMGGGTPRVVRQDDVALLILESCRSHLLSSGRVPPAEIAAAAELIEPLGDCFVFLCLHYPLRGRDGGPYRPFTRALSNAADVERMLRSTDRIGAVLHGHEHHGFSTTVHSGRGPIRVLDPGATGHARFAGRTAHFNVYRASREGLGEIRRLAWNGHRFQDEEGGPYVTGG